MENMKRFLTILTAVVMLLMAGVVAEEVAPAEEALVLLDQTSVAMDYSQTLTLTAANGGDVRWSSSDESVARLSANNGERVEVTGIHTGTAVITCTSGDQQQSCEVTVTAPSTLQITGVDYPSTFRMAGRGWKLRRGVLASNVDLATLTTVLKAADGTTIGSAYTHTFGDGVRRYEINGLDNYVPFSWISAEGAYTWTLSATDVSGRMVSVSLPINAVADGETAISNESGAQSPVIVVSEIVLDNAEISLQRGETRQIAATVSPREALNSGVIWVSADPSVAVVSLNGEVTGVGIGTTTITCRTLGDPDISASCVATVLEKLEADASQLLYGTNTVSDLTEDGSSWASMHWRAASGGTGVRESIAVADAPGPGIRLGWKLAWEAGAVDIAQNGVPIQAGEIYTLSCYARGAGKLRLQVGQGPAYPCIECEVNGSDWQRYEMPYTFGEADEGSGSGATNVYFGCSGGEIEICGMKLERGGVSSEWTAAAGEVDAQQNGMQLLHGTKGTSTLAEDGMWTRAHWRAASGGTGGRESIAVADAPIEGIELGWKLTWENGLVDIAQERVPIQVGRIYTLSCYARGKGKLRLQVGMGPEYSNIECEVDSPNWQRYEMVHTFGEADEGSGNGMTNAYFGCSGGSVEICGMKLELGSAASDWSTALGEGD